jgi:hypothetical protein
VLSKGELSSSVVANAMALVKNRMPEFDAEILRKDFTINDAEPEVLVDSAYDTAQYLCPCMIFLRLLSPMITLVLVPSNLSSASYNKL